MILRCQTLGESVLEGLRGRPFGSMGLKCVARKDRGI